jgi:hypothetical protein
MSVLNAGLRKVESRTIDDDDDEYDDDMMEDARPVSRTATVIEFLLIQPKSLQSCKIVYEDAASKFKESVPVIVKDEIKIKVEREEQDAREIEKESDQLKEAADKMMTLMSPDSFMTEQNIVVKEDVDIKAEMLLSPSQIKQEVRVTLMVFFSSCDVLIKIF